LKSLKFCACINKGNIIGKQIDVDITVNIIKACCDEKFFMRIVIEAKDGLKGLKRSQAAAGFIRVGRTVRYEINL